MYTALYRKLRPKTFNDVVGQPHIVQTLTNQIKTGRIFHAYLFCGTRGTGKTSTAKILAKAVNCTSPVDAEPCSVCEVCRQIEAGASLNVIEIDAASNNGVENIRDIREEVRYAPTEGKYKVYIIDEVHMLSTGAFNALLKTLEEPPAYVIFILATTDPHKIPATIHSRCQRFDFRRITADEMAAALKEYTQEEGIRIQDEAIRYIVQICDGAMRDALSILDQCVTFFYGEEITQTKVLGIVGSVDSTVFYKMTDALSRFDSRECLEIIQETVLQGKDINQFVMEFVVHLRDLLVSKNIEGDSYALDVSKETRERLVEFAKNISQDTLINYITEFSCLQQQLKFSANQRILFEVMCIKLCHPFVLEKQEAIISRLERLEYAAESGVKPAKMENKTDVVVVEEEINQTKTVKQTETKQNNQEITEPNDELKKIKTEWQSIIKSLALPTLRLPLTKSKPIGLTSNLLTIKIEGSEVQKKLVKTNENKIIEELKKKFGKAYELSFTLDGTINQPKTDKSEKSNFTDLFDDDIMITEIEE